MTVHFIGAGPGAADLITLRGRDLLAACDVCLYAGSIVPATLLAHCPNADIRVLPGTGHWAAYESADMVNAILHEMLARTRP